MQIRSGKIIQNIFCYYLIGFFCAFLSVTFFTLCFFLLNPIKIIFSGQNVCKQSIQGHIYENNLKSKFTFACVRFCSRAAWRFIQSGNKNDTTCLCVSRHPTHEYSVKTIRIQSIELTTFLRSYFNSEYWINLKELQSAHRYAIKKGFR